MTRSRRAVPAFAVVDACVLVLTLAVLALLLAVMGARARRLANLGEDINKLHDIAFGTDLFAAQADDRIWALSWRGGVRYSSPWPDLNLATTDLQAQANQAVEILRRHAGRTDIPMIGGWIPQILYSHLPLADFLQAPLPWLTFVSSADADRLRWAMDPACFERNCFLPCQQPGGHVNSRWPYSASFQLTAAFWDQSAPGSRVEQITNNTFLSPDTARLHPQRLSDVSHPADKVMVMDEFARHFGRDTAIYFAHPDARLPLLFADGAARLKFTRDANPGWNPNHPERVTVVDAYIRTGVCTPGMPSGYMTTDHREAPGVFRWTRCGLSGRDFGQETTCSDAQPARSAVTKPSILSP